MSLSSDLPTEVLAAPSSTRLKATAPIVALATSAAGERFKTGVVNVDPNGAPGHGR